MPFFLLSFCSLLPFQALPSLHFFFVPSFLSVFLSFSPPPCLLVSLGYLRLLSFTRQVALVVKNLPVSAGDIGGRGSIPGWRRSPGGGHGNPPHYSCLGNPRDRGLWWALVQRVTKSQIQLKWLSITALYQPHLKDTLRGGHSSGTPAIGPVQQSLPRWTLALPARSVQIPFLYSIFLLHSE